MAWKNMNDYEVHEVAWVFSLENYILSSKVAYGCCES